MRSSTAALDTSLASAARPRRLAAVRWTAIAVIAASLLVVLSRLPIAAAVAALEERIATMGPWGPIAYGAAYVVAVVLLAPASALTLAAGALFGLWVGTATVSVASTTGAALAFLVARYVARERVAARIGRYPKFAAIDRAIQDGGWKVVAMLRLSPAVPFNLQNYLYGLTGIRFWTCVLTSWVAMLPGTFLYVYFGYLAREGAQAAAGGAADDRALLTWIARLVGLAATIGVTVYVTRLARRALARTGGIEPPADVPAPSPAASTTTAAGFPWRTAVLAVVAVACAAGAALTVAKPGWLGGLFGPPQVEAREAYATQEGGPTVDHARLDGLLRRHVDADGYVDYAALARDAGELDAYLAALAGVPFAELGRDEKLALLLNAYNAATLRLILDHYPVASIQDIPADERWSAVRWRVGPHTWSLDRIEHQEIRPNFAEPRIHFALVCAAVGCPPLRAEAYDAARLEEQLAGQAAYVHSHDRWYRYEPGSGVVHLTKLYDWYGGDFVQAAGSVLAYAARHDEHLDIALDTGREPEVRWLDYDWALNDVTNRR